MTTCFRLVCFAVMVPLLGACTTEVMPMFEPEVASLETTEPVPEAVAAVALPGQDLRSAQVMDDGCYWYRHVGPVETTMLPLRTIHGRPICARRGLF